MKKEVFDCGMADLEVTVDDGGNVTFDNVADMFWLTIPPDAWSKIVDFVANTEYERLWGPAGG